jgi:hypothetical protein
VSQSGGPIPVTCHVLRSWFFGAATRMRFCHVLFGPVPVMLVHDLSNRLKFLYL